MITCSQVILDEHNYIRTEYSHSSEAAMHYYILKASNFSILNLNSASYPTREKELAMIIFLLYKKISQDSNVYTPHRP